MEHVPLFDRIVIGLMALAIIAILTTPLYSCRMFGVCGMQPEPHTGVALTA